MSTEDVFDIGETVICSVVVKDADGNGQDPVTSMKITIRDSKRTVHVDGVAMTPDTGDGVYHYDFASAGVRPGTYTIKYVATDGPRITIEEDTFILT